MDGPGRNFDIVPNGNGRYIRTAELRHSEPPPDFGTGYVKATSFLGQPFLFGRRLTN